MGHLHCSLNVSMCEGLLPAGPGDASNAHNNSERVHSSHAYAYVLPTLILPTLENNVEMAESSSESEFEADFIE